MTPTASDLFASAHGLTNSGVLACHWCASPCNGWHRHDEPPPAPFQKKLPSAATVPSSPYLCQGCWLWRRRHASLPTLGGRYVDRQPAERLSWLMASGQARVVTPADGALLYPILLSPPPHFSLALLVNGPPASGLRPCSGGPFSSRLQAQVVNDLSGACVDTPLHFTVNGVGYRYTVYELEEAMRSSGDHNGKEAGVRVLMDLLGPPPALPERVVEHRGRGAEKAGDGKVTKRPLQASG